MSNTTIDLPSGTRLEIQVAPFSVGTKLYKTIANELKTVSIGANLDLAQLGQMDVNDLKGALFQLLGSDALEQAVFDCFKYTVYNGEKGVTRATFEAEDARGDYLPAAWEVIRVNVTPFFKSLGSLLSAFAAPTSNDPK